MTFKYDSDVDRWELFRDTIKKCFAECVPKSMSRKSDKPPWSNINVRDQNKKVAWLRINKGTPPWSTWRTTFIRAKMRQK